MSLAIVLASCNGMQQQSVHRIITKKVKFSSCTRSHCRPFMFLSFYLRAWILILKMRFLYVFLFVLRSFSFWYIGDILGILNEHTLIILKNTPWTLSGHKTDTYLTLREHSADTQQTLSWHSADTQLTLSVHSVDTQLTLSKHSGDTQGTLSGHSADTQQKLSRHSEDTYREH